MDFIYLKHCMHKPIDLRNRIIALELHKGADLTPNMKNWRTHPDTQQTALAGVLAKIGISGAILAYHSDRNGGRLTVIDGHLRRENWRDVEWPVLVTDLSDDEADYMLTVFDPLGAMAEADYVKLAGLVEQFQDDETAMGILSAVMDLQLLLGDQGGASGGDDGDGGRTDRAAELQEIWKVQPGDLWKIGRHRLLCGDSTKPEDVTRLLGGEQPNLMVTDPPYGVEYDPHWRDEIVGEFGQREARGEKAENDDLIDWSPAYRLAPCNVAYVWHAGIYTSEVQASLELSGYQIRSQIIWAKQHFAISRGHYHWKHEPCWYAVKKGATASWIGDRTQHTIWEISSLNPAGRSEERMAHGTQKPIECMQRPLRNHEGDVYDPFCGSGTTIVAAERERRRAFAMELKPEFCAVTLQRMKEAYPEMEIERLP